MVRGAPVERSAGALRFSVRPEVPEREVSFARPAVGSFDVRSDGGSPTLVSTAQDAARIMHPFRPLQIRSESSPPRNFPLELRSRCAIHTGGTARSCAPAVHAARTAPKEREERLRWPR